MANGSIMTIERWSDLKKKKKKQNKKQTNLAQKRTQSIKESTCMKLVAMEKQHDMTTNNFAKFCQN